MLPDVFVFLRESRPQTGQTQKNEDVFVFFPLTTREVTAVDGTNMRELRQQSFR